VKCVNINTCNFVASQGRRVSDVAGLLPYIWVDDTDGTLAAVAIHDREVVEGPRVDVEPDGEWIATLRAPAGNLIGRYQQGPRRRWPCRSCSQGAAWLPVAHVIVFDGSSCRRGAVAWMGRSCGRLGALWAGDREQPPPKEAWSCRDARPRRPDAGRLCAFSRHDDATSDGVG
jgi:hypothetical protein